MIGHEVDLLVNYPRPTRDVRSRAIVKTEEHRAIARRFGRDFFDGDRSVGYGGFQYHPRFWEPTIPTIREHFRLNSSSSLLDVGCAKGFMLYDLTRLIPGIRVQGVDISEYAIDNAMVPVRDLLQVADARKLPFPDNSFDVVISINTVHNLDLDGVIKALGEIQRVSKLGSFITVDAYRNDEEKARMMDWNLTAKTILSVDDWKDVFRKSEYQGDFFWFIP